MLVLIVTIATNFRAVTQPQPAYAASFPVGLGSYTDILPPGGSLPANSNGAPVSPKITGNVSGAIPTNDWWSSLVFQRYPGNPYSENMFAHPLAFHAKANGLGTTYPNALDITPDGRKYQYTYTEDFTLGVVGLNAPDTKVDGFSDWTVTAAWSDGARSLKTTIGHGLPYVYATKSGGDAQIVFNGAPTIWSNSNGVIGASIRGRDYGIFAPSGSTWTVSGSTLTSNLNGRDFFSVAALPNNSAATLSDYRAHAFAFVTGTRVSWSYDAATANLTTTYNVTTIAREGTETRPLLALYRHQWLNSAAPNTSYTYVSPRGQMKVIRGSSFSTAMRFNGVLPALPDAGTYNRTTLYNYVNEVYLSPDLIPPSSTDTYWAGKALGRLAMLTRIADQVGHPQARDRFLGAMKTELQKWLSAPNGKTSSLFYYNQTWGLLTGYPASYGSDSEINDHHFHWSYYIMAAATIAQYDPNWASDSNWGGMIKLLIKDAANWDATDTRFPRLRNFDPYAGHGWASGHQGFAAGNNNESSSEAMNFNTALILWGAATNDNTIRDLGIYLYTNEARAIEEYWFDAQNTTFPASYGHTTVGMVWGDGGSYSTWWTANPEEIHGINFLPITGGSLYLGRNPGYINTNYNELRAGNGGEEQEWRDIIWSFQALSDPGAAIAKFNANSGYTPEAGDSKAHTYHWLHNLNALGHLDTTITANIPTYAVFNKAGTRTYVAYNPGASAITVSFSNGITLNVPARTLVSGNGSVGPTPTPVPPTATPINPTATPINPTATPVPPTATPTPPPPAGDAYFTLVNRHSNKCLDVNAGSTADGAKVQQWPCNGATAQQWRLKPMGNGSYQLVARPSGKCADIVGGSTADGALVHQWGCGTGTNQQWTLETVAEGWVRLINRNSGKALSITNGSTADGAQAHQWPWLNNADQQWRLAPVGAVTLVNKNSSKCADVAGGATGEGVNIQQWTCNGSSAQKWTFQHADNGWYSVISQVSNKAIEVNGGTADGTNIRQWSANGCACQHWRIETLGDGSFRLVVRHSNKVFDVAGSGTADGTNIQQWTWNSSNAQRFFIR
ncbi:MAG: RICIN domain-containing protein [Herpetosiphonaceae bacterium]|nr:RICIN domain-containing protein [Herpetosiphonaceae bacterium]